MLRSDHEQNLPDSLWGRKRGDVDAAFPGLWNAKHDGWLPVEAIAISLGRHLLESSPQAVDRFDQLALRPFAKNHQIVIRPGVADMQLDLFPLAHTDAVRITTLGQLPELSGILLVMRPDVFPFYGDPLFVTVPG